MLGVLLCRIGLHRWRYLGWSMFLRARLYSCDRCGRRCTTPLRGGEGF